MIDEQELFGDGSHEIAIEHGTVGWPGDDLPYDLGTESNDGNTLIKVTLFRGHEAGKAQTDDGRANGALLLCRISGPFWRIPRKGEQCFVAFPHGFGTTPGIGVIVAYPGKNPFKQFQANAAILSCPGYDVVIKARSVTLRDEAGNSISVSEQGGCRMIDATGSGVVVKDGQVLGQSIDDSGNVRGALTLGQDETSLINCAAMAGTKFVTAGMVAIGKTMQLNYTTSISFGISASPATKIMVGPASGTTSIGSQTMFGSP